METLALHELHKICRICLKSDVLVSIYTTHYIIRPIEMLQKLQIFKGTDDTLPSLLCQSCLYRLLDAYNLQKLAEASERRLREFIFIPTSAGSLSNLTPDISITPSTSAMDLVKSEGGGDCSTVSMYANICDMMFDRHDVTNDMVEVVGTDDVELLNDVEIDVSSLTRSEADENTLGSRMAFEIQEHQTFPLFETEKEKQIAKDSCVKKPRKLSMKLLSKALKTPDKCLECGKVFNYKGYLEIHRRVHTGEKPFKCQICTREFITSTKLLLHQRIHSSDKSTHKRFQCEICSAFFATSSNLKSHKLTHTTDRNHPCKHCHMSFKSPRDLKRHEPMHKTTRDIFCCICGKSFTKRASLNAHSASVHHNRRRKHECTECDKIFGKKSNLINHMRIHSGEKPFQCPTCPWKFAQSSALKRHMKKHSKSSLMHGQTTEEVKTALSSAEPSLIYTTS